MTTILCPICGKKVGAWHASGVHPSCEARSQRPQAAPAPKQARATVRMDGKALGTPEAIAAMPQARRDAILRSIRGK